MLTSINTGTSANDGTGDTPRAAGVKINANMLDLQARQGSILRSRTQIVYDGDSKAPEAQFALQWAVCRMGLDVDVWSGTNYGVGGSNSTSAGTGLTSSSRMASTLSGIQQTVAGGVVVDVSLRMFTNDVSMDPTTSMTNLKTYHNQVVRAAGARYLLLWGCEPQATQAAYNSWAYTMNRLMEQYAAENSHDVLFLDCTNVLTDPAAGNASGFPIPYTYDGSASPTLGSVMRDQLHKSNYGCYVMAKALAPIRRLYPRRPLPVLSQTNGYGSSRLRGNMAGQQARTVATGGSQNSFTNSGTGTVTGTPPNSLLLQGTITGSLSLTWAADSITITDDEGPLPRGTWPTVSCTLSGTTTGGNSGAQIQLGQYPQGVNPNVSGTLISTGFLLYMDQVRGLLGFDAGGAGMATCRLGTNVNNGTGSTPASEPINEAVTGAFLAENFYTTNISNAQMSNNVWLAPNTTCSGKIHYLLPFMAHRQDALA